MRSFFLIVHLLLLLAFIALCCGTGAFLIFNDWLGLSKWLAWPVGIVFFLVGFFGAVSLFEEWIKEAINPDKQ
jgi:hypothetical protein